MALSDLAIRQAKATGKAYTLPDVDGLALAVSPTGGKSWHFRYDWQGKQKRASVKFAGEFTFEAVLRQWLAHRELRLKKGRQTTLSILPRVEKVGPCDRAHQRRSACPILCWRWVDGGVRCRHFRGGSAGAGHGTDWTAAVSAKGGTVTSNAHGLSKLTVRLIAMAAVLSVIHHIDHVLRVDHSGWPFKPQVTPFTFSLLAYPMMAFALWGKREWFWIRWTMLALGTVFTLMAHSLVESPLMQYQMWADNCSADPAAAGLRNLLDIQSPVAGVLSATVSMCLNLTAFCATVSMFFDGWKGRLRRP